MPDVASLIRELRRRRVWRAAGLYVVGLVAVVEAADLILPRLGFGDGLVTAVLIAGLVGFPIAVGFSWAFDLVPDRGDGHPSQEPDAETSGPERGAARGTGLWATVGAAALLAAVGGGWWMGQRAGPPRVTGIDQGVVAVFPWRVSGAEQLAYLGEGMMDLLAAKLNGEVGPRAVDPGTTLSALDGLAGGEGRAVPRDVLLSVAGGLGAGRALVGSVVGTRDRLILNAELVDVRDGVVLAETSAEGPESDLQQLTDRLSAELLSLDAGEEEQRLASLTTRSLPALRRYLEGMAAYRDGDFDGAVARLGEALALDSTFALAAIGQADAADFVPGLASQSMRARAWRYRERLSERDRTLLTAMLGPRYPEPSAGEDRLDAWRRATDLLPDRVDVWYGYGDELLHYASLVGLDDWHERAIAAFDRALAIDSVFAAVIMHRSALALAADDPGTVARLATVFERRGADGEVSSILRFQLAASRGDRQQMEGWWTPTRAFERNELYYAIVDRHWVPDAAVYAVRAVDALLELNSPLTVRAQDALEGYLVALDAGRPTVASNYLQVSERAGPLPDQAPYAVVGALFAGGDVTDAEERLDRMATGNGATDEELCARAFWDVRTGASDGSEAALRERVESSIGDEGVAPVCAALVEAAEAAAAGATDASVRVARVDSLLRGAPRIPFWLRGAADLWVSELWEAVGEPERALASARRRVIMIPQVAWTSELVLREARLAIELGRPAEAVGPLRLFLALRTDPEPAAAEEVAWAAERLREIDG